MFGCLLIPSPPNPSTTPAVALASEQTLSDSKLECVDIPLGTFTLYQASSFSVANVVFDVWLNVIQLNGYRGFALSAC